MAERLFFGTNTEGVKILERRAGQFQLVGRAFEGIPAGAAASDPTCGIVYIGTHEGTYKTADGGKNWKKLTSHLEHQTAVYLYVDRDSHRVYLGTHPIELYVSDDHGESWTKINFVEKIPPEIREKWVFHPYPAYGPHIKSIATSQGRLYVNIEEGWCYRSDDEGESFTPLLWGGLHIDAHVLATHPFNRDVVFSTHAYGAAKSTDGGESWKDIEDVCSTGIEDYGGGIAVHPRNPNIVVMCTGFQRTAPVQIQGADAKIFRSTDGGDSWHCVMSGFADRVEAIVFDNQSDPTAYAATEGGEVLESRDGGEHWQVVARDLGATYMYGLAVL